MLSLLRSRQRQDILIRNRPPIRLELACLPPTEETIAIKIFPEPKNVLEPAVERVVGKQQITEADNTSKRKSKKEIALDLLTIAGFLASAYTFTKYFFTRF